MTTLEEFKEIEANATKGPWTKGTFQDTGFLNQVSIQPSIGAVYGAKNEAETNAEIIAISRSALPALIAVAEGMAEALKFYADFDHDREKGLYGQYMRTIEGVPSQEYFLLDEGSKATEALAAFEAWKNEIEGEK